jgi:hypothetical protein
MLFWLVWFLRYNVFMNTKSILGASFILGLFMVLAVAVGGYAFYLARGLDNTVSVTGSAERTVTSDIVKWNANFSRNVAEAQVKEGYQQMKKDLDLAISYLKENGVTENQITVRPAYLNPVYDFDKFSGSSKMTGYQIQQSIVIESVGEVKKITALSQEAPAALAGKGLLFSTQNLEYYYSKFADLKVEMLTDATTNATERAKRIAESTGAKLGRLQSASMGVFQVTSLNSQEVSDYGYFDSSSIEKKVTAVVRAAFSLK